MRVTTKATMPITVGRRMMSVAVAVLALGKIVVGTVVVMVLLLLRHSCWCCLY